MYIAHRLIQDLVQQIRNEKNKTKCKNKSKNNNYNEAEHNLVFKAERDVNTKEESRVFQIDILWGTNELKCYIVLVKGWLKL